MNGFNFLGSPYSGNGLQMKPQSLYEDGIGLRPQTPMMTQGEGMTMASMPSNFGQMSASQSLDPQMAMFALKTMQANQPKAAPMIQNNIPMGRAMSYEDIMRSYGITGLMG